MLIHGASNNIAWDELPDDTNIVESMHNQYRLVEHSNLYVEMQNLFNIDRNAVKIARQTVREMQSADKTIVLTVEHLTPVKQESQTFHRWHKVFQFCVLLPMN